MCWVIKERSISEAMAIDRKITTEAYVWFEAFRSNYITDSNLSPRNTRKRARSLNKHNGAIHLSNLISIRSKGSWHKYIWKFMNEFSTSNTGHALPYALLSLLETRVIYLGGHHPVVFLSVGYLFLISDKYNYIDDSI